jgi:hypothetical protein
VDYEHTCSIISPASSLAEEVKVRERKIYSNIYYSLVEMEEEGLVSASLVAKDHVKEQVGENGSE